MPAEEYFNLYKRCVDIQSIQFTLDDFKKFQKSTNVRIFEDKNCIAILGLTDIEIEIYFIGVARSYRGKGLGKKLLKSIISFSKNYGAKVIILEVGAKNVPAKKIYLSLDFKECGIRKDYYKNRSGFRQDALIMKLNLET
jgi:ribosomal protein S18 acetylase RimI-like enzyme